MNAKALRYSLIAATAALFATAGGLGAMVKAARAADTPQQESAGVMLDDTVITAKVKAAFVQDEKVSALRIGVTSNKGVVQLSGFANSGQEADHAAAVARTVPGVKQVKNDILVKRTP